MSIKPILFNTQMVRAILEGRKTVTRRVIKPHYREGDAGFRINRMTATGEIMGVEIIDDYECGTDRYVKPPYMPGYVLYVRETVTRCGNPKIGIPMHYEYRADMENPNYTSRGFMATWTPSIHMPKEAARIWLNVTEVSVERLHDMTVEDAIAEGLDASKAKTAQGYVEYIVWNMMKKLWDFTIKKSELDKYGWEENPWVWVIRFKRIEKP